MNQKNMLLTPDEYNSQAELGGFLNQANVEKRANFRKKCILAFAIFLSAISIVAPCAFFILKISRFENDPPSKIMCPRGTDAQSVLAFSDRFPDPLMCSFDVLDVSPIQNLENTEQSVQDALLGAVQVNESKSNVSEDIGISTSIKSYNSTHDIIKMSIPAKTFKIGIMANMNPTNLETVEKVESAFSTKILSMAPGEIVSNQSKIAMALAHSIVNGFEPPFPLDNICYVSDYPSLKFSFLQDGPINIQGQENNYYYHIAIRGCSKLLVSIKNPKNPLMLLSKSSPYLVSSSIIFKNPGGVVNPNRPNEVWTLIDGCDLPIPINNGGSLKKISLYINDLIEALISIEDNGYAIDDPYALKVFESRVCYNSDEFETLKLFDDGNFVKLDSEKKGGNNSANLLAIQGLIHEVAKEYFGSMEPSGGFKELADGRLYVSRRMNLMFIDFYLIITGRTENEVEKLSDLLRHPFVAGKELEDWDVFGTRFPVILDNNTSIKLYSGIPKEKIYRN